MSGRPLCTPGSRAGNAMENHTPLCGVIDVAALQRSPHPDHTLHLMQKDSHALQQMLRWTAAHWTHSHEQEFPD